jgi:putative oxidoreductase
MTSPAARLSALAHHPDAGLLLARLWLGFLGVFHGSQKLFGLFGGSGLRGFAGFLEGMNVPAPTLSAVLAGSAEFFGGFLLAMGIVPRLAVVPFIFTMLVAYFTAHGGKFSAAAGGGEYALTIAVLLSATILTGPGRYTPPSLLRGRAHNPRLSPA